MKLSLRSWLAIAGILAISGAAVSFGLQPPPEGGSALGPPGGPGAGESRLLGDDFGPPGGPPPRGDGDFRGGPGPRGGRPPGPPRGEGFDPGPYGDYGGGLGPGPGDRRGPVPPPPTPLEASDEKLRTLLDQEDELFHETERLADEVRRKDGSKDDLQTAVARQFELRHEIRQRKIELLEEQLAALKGALTKRQEQKDLLIEARMAELLDLPSPVDF